MGKKAVIDITQGRERGGTENGVNKQKTNNYTCNKQFPKNPLFVVKRKLNKSKKKITREKGFFNCLRPVPPVGCTFFSVWGWGVVSPPTPTSAPAIIAPSSPLPSLAPFSCIVVVVVSLFSRERENEFLSFSSLLHIPEEKEGLGKDVFMEHYETGIYSIYCETGEEDFRSESCSFGRGGGQTKISLLCFFSCMKLSTET